MARKKSFAVAKQIPGVRKTLFHLYGELVFRRHFDLAMRYSDAAKVEKGGEPFPYDLLGPEGRQLARDDSFEEVRKRIGELIMSGGPEVIIELGSLLSGISECENRPVSKDRLQIGRAHQLLITKLRRPPALEELRKDHWLITAQLAAEKKVGAQGIQAVDALLQSDWSDQSNRLAPIKDAKQFMLTVKDMGLALFDGKLLRRYRQCFDKLKSTLKRKPTVEEYASAARDLASRTGKPLRDASLHEFIEYLANPIDQHPLSPQWDANETRSLVRKFLSKKTKASKEQVSAAILLFDGIASLDKALDVMRVGLPEVPLPSLPRSRTLDEAFTQLAGELKRLPWADDVLMTCEENQLSEIARELNTSPKIKGVWLRIAVVLKQDKTLKSVPLALLIDEMPEMRLLTQVFKSIWLQFWPRLLWAEFSQSLAPRLR